VVSIGCGYERIFNHLKASNGQTSENELEGGNTRNMRNTSTYKLAKLGHYRTD